MKDDLQSSGSQDNQSLERYATVQLTFTSIHIVINTGHRIFQIKFYASFWPKKYNEYLSKLPSGKG